MMDPAWLAIVAWKEILDATKPQQGVFLNFIFLKLLWGKKMALYNEASKAEIENSYDLKKLEWRIELEKKAIKWNTEIQKIKQEQEILLLINEVEKEVENKNMAWVIQKAISKIEENAIWNIDPDKFKRLKDLSKEFESDDLQEIIAKILAWEYNKPWTYSLQAMSIVKNLSTDEINLFRKFCWLVVDWEFIFWKFFELQNENNVTLIQKWTNYNDYLYLQELWLCTGTDASTNIWNNEQVYIYKFVIADKELILSLKKEITLSGKYLLTKAWKEIFNLIEPIFDEELFEMTKKELIRQGFEEIS